MFHCLPCQQRIFKSYLQKCSTEVGISSRFMICLTCVSIAFQGKNTAVMLTFLGSYTDSFIILTNVSSGFSDTGIQESLEFSTNESTYLVLSGVETVASVIL